jgi:hypothetical protein
MNGIEAVRSACSRVSSSRIDAQLISFMLIRSMTTSAGAPTVGRRIHLCDMISADFS